MLQKKKPLSEYSLYSAYHTVYYGLGNFRFSWPVNYVQVNGLLEWQIDLLAVLSDLIRSQLENIRGGQI